MLEEYEKGIFDPKAYPDDEYVYDGCNCGNCHLTILSDGAVYACRRMESKVGNALTDDLYDLFTGPEFDKYRVYENFEKCSKCELLRFCRGYPAAAKGYHIAEGCIGCGKCVKVCPQGAIEKGKPSVIHQEHCLHCGNCFENCPVSIIKHRT